MPHIHTSRASLARRYSLQDFQKFNEGFQEVINYIKRERPEFFNPDGSAISSIGAASDKAHYNNGGVPN